MKIISITHNAVPGGYSHISAVVEGNIASIAELVSAAIVKPYELIIQPIRKKRSLDANGLLWVCLQRMAEALETDKWSVYLQELKRYGQFTYIVVKPAAVEAVKKQWRETEVIGEVKVNGSVGIQMLCYYGSSTYNSKEFSVLLNGVISDMKEMGLEAPESAEIKRVIDEIQKHESDN